MSKHGQHLTIGDCIEKLRALKPDTHVEFDFGGIVPTKLASWRGIYAEIALGFSGGAFSNDEPKTVAELLSDFQSAVGKTYTGWKGGDFVMGLDTPVWVDNPGCYTRTYITNITGDDYGVTIHTDQKDEL